MRSRRVGWRGSTVASSLTATHDVSRVAIWKARPRRSIR